MNCHDCYFMPLASCDVAAGAGAATIRGARVSCNKKAKKEERRKEKSMKKLIFHALQELSLSFTLLNGTQGSEDKDERATVG